MVSQNGYKDDLVGTSWIGEVVDIEDPQKVGRIRVKVYGKFDDLEKESIPWAYPGTNNTAGSASGGGFHSVPKLGSIVSIKFDNGNIYHPEYFFNQKISDEVKEEISGSYANSHVIIYDSVTEGSLKIFFTEEKGLMLDYKGTQINIKPDKNIDVTTTADLNIKCANMIVDHANSIELGKGAQELSVLGNSFMDLFNNHTHIANLGAPTSIPVVLMTKAQLSQKQVKLL
jgi:hypothetical protein